MMTTKAFYITIVVVLVVMLGSTFLIMRANRPEMIGGRGMGPMMGMRPMMGMQGMQGMNAMNMPAVAPTSQGAVVFRDNKLIRFAGSNLADKKELDIATEGGIGVAALAVMQDSAAAEHLLVLRGDTLLVIDPAAMIITRKITIPASASGSASDTAICPMGQMCMATGGAMKGRDGGMASAGDVIYLIRADELLAVNILTGTVVSADL